MSYVVCVPHLQDGCGALHLACQGGHTELVRMLVKEYWFPPDRRDNVSILIVHGLEPYMMSSLVCVMRKFEAVVFTGFAF